MKRREFFASVAAVAAASTFGKSTALAGVLIGRPTGKKLKLDVAAIDRTRVIADAEQYLNEAPETVVAHRAERSSGGIHDFYSEGDYWWPDPKNPSAPYVRRDGESNPENFVAHRTSLMRLSVMVPALAAAWKFTGRKEFAGKAREHAVAWFVDPSTKMSPNLQHAQAIKGITDGRGTGIIDTIHLVEVTRALRVMKASDAWKNADEYAAIQEWFSEYVQWMTTSKNGIEERDATNNHGSCWVMQVGAFAAFTGDKTNLRYCSDRFKNKLIPEQVAADGSLPLELARTKPYSYCLFDMDILSIICQTLSLEHDDLWAFSTKDGRGMKSVIGYMAPFIADKSKWPKPPDVEYFNDLPVRQPSLLFGGLAYQNADWIALWKRTNPEPKVVEIVRNFPVRQPSLWIAD